MIQGRRCPTVVAERYLGCAALQRYRIQYHRYVLSLQTLPGFNPQAFSRTKCAQQNRFLAQIANPSLKGRGTYVCASSHHQRKTRFQIPFMFLCPYLQPLPCSASRFRTSRFHAIAALPASPGVLPSDRIAAWACPRAFNSALMIALRAITIAVPDGSVSRAFFIWPKHGGIIASVGNRNRPCHAVSLGHRSW